MDDAYENGTCIGRTVNTCGLPANFCQAYNCDEGTRSCGALPVREGQACTPTDLCRVNGVCQFGQCVGVPRDCSASPLNECNTVSCDPGTGDCVGTADATKDGTACSLTGDICHLNRTCSAGQCTNGTPRDCSLVDVGCQVGVCNPTSGLCEVATQMNGSSCNDHNACTQNDACTAGVCSGTVAASCSAYREAFDVCPAGWTLGGDWQCGVPSNVGPMASRGGVLGTQLAGDYSVNQAFGTAVADSSPIDLITATSPMLSLWTWQHTEGGTFDGWNLKVSTDNGQNFTVLTTVSPAYDLSIAGEPAWGGDNAAQGWTNRTADLSAYVGQVVVLRLSFRSDGATVFPGIYVDDVVVGEPAVIPLSINTRVLPDVFGNDVYAAQVERSGGSPAAEWAIVPGGVNNAWLTVDPATGVLTGTPTLQEEGPVTVTLRVAEPSQPSNAAVRTYTFNVKHASYYTSFEGGCPVGWTLTGDWACGVPTLVGPPTAYLGTQCVGTVLDGIYNNLQTFAGTTATSPDIDLTGVAAPQLTFRMWVDTEGSTYDGVNLNVSNDGGMNYTLVTAVTPAYTLTVAGQPAWGGHQAALGWQLVQADLSAYAGQVIRLRFSFRTDSSGTFPGVYVDDVYVP